MNFFTKALLKSKLKSAGVPEDQMEKLLTMIEKNPNFFNEVAMEAQKKVAAGMGQQEAVMEVMKDKQDVLKKMMSSS
jgi:hypothetical protein